MIYDHDDPFLMQTGFQATKDLGDPAGIFMGEREYFFFAFWHHPTTVISFLSIFIPPWHPRQFSRTCGFCNASCWFSFVELFTIVGWFTLVENSQWCWTLVIHHYMYWEPLEILDTDMKGGNHCQNEKILFNKTKEVFVKDSLLDFHTVIFCCYK